MSIVRSIDFEDNTFKVCYSGQALRGNVNISFPSPTQVKAIYITFVGKGSCKFQMGDRGSPRRVTGSKTYLDEKIHLLPVSDDCTFMSAGDHEYPFALQLSNKVATSYEGTYGYVRYVATLHIERPAQKIDPLKETFTVIRALNLNNQTLYRLPMEKRLYISFNQFCLFSCWKTPLLKLFGRLPVSGYCPGQTMNLKLDMINNSDKDVLYILVQFVKEVTYRSNNGYKKIERVVVAERRTERWRANRSGIQSTKVNITVPSLPPTNYATDNLCGFNYFFRISAVTGLCNPNATFRMPVVIGTYPILDELYSEPQAAENNENPFSDSYLATAPHENSSQRPSSADLDSTQLPPYPESDPPTYEEAMRSSETTNENFVPKYPTFKRGTKYANQDLN